MLRQGEEEVIEVAKNLEEEKDLMTRCLEEAKECWKDVFYQEGGNRSFGKYVIPPEPVAISMIAVAIFSEIS